MPSQTRIPLSVPVFVGREAEYLQECIDSGWVSSRGPFVGEFERAFARYHGHHGAVATASGTAALHLALAALGIGPGDEVVVPALTFIATVNPVAYVGATPVFADVRADTFTIDPEHVAALVGPRTRAIVAVHLFGQPADMDPLLALAREHGLAVVEDATEALGSRYKDRLCGTLGDIGCFSFNGNKVITSGGGGMLLCDDDVRLEHMRVLSLQGRVPGSVEYLHDEVGYNYVLSNLHAAIGLAQLEGLDERLRRKRELAARYHAGLAGADDLTVFREPDWATSNYWLNSVLVDARHGRDRGHVMETLSSAGIDSRPFFHPVHLLPPYRRLASGGGLPVSERLHAQGLSLPSSPSLTDADQDRVIGSLLG